MVQACAGGGRPVEKWLAHKLLLSHLLSEYSGDSLLKVLVWLKEELILEGILRPCCCKLLLRIQTKCWHLLLPCNSS